jgi:hypothetical protein
MHTHHFLQLQHCNATKNKLQHEAFEYFKSLDGLLIEKEQLPQLKKRIEEEIEKLNKKYPRMKPIKISYPDFNYKNSIWVTSVEAISFKIIQAKLIIPEQLPYFSPTLN